MNMKTTHTPKRDAMTITVAPVKLRVRFAGLGRKTHHSDKRRNTVRNRNWSNYETAIGA